MLGARQPFPATYGVRDRNRITRNRSAAQATAMSGPPWTWSGSSAYGFGAGPALVNDFHQAEDVVEEAFVAAWSALPNLADPTAFPVAARHGPTPGVPRAAQKDTADRAARGSSGFAMRGGVGRPPPGAAPAIGDGAGGDRRAARQATGASDAVLYPRLLASGHCGLYRPAGGDGQQPPACRPFKAEGEDARHGE
jgi:hypothetical protein